MTTQAGSAPSAPALQTPSAPATLPAPSAVLSQTVQSLLNKAANGFEGPRLQASIALDNFLQMQYEIVAKQLTTLRDETGAHRRILFLEMPTSIQASDRRVLLMGGEDKLAQSWWRISKVWHRYKTETSPCWIGRDYDEEELRYAKKTTSATSDSGVLLGQLANESAAMENAYSSLGLDEVFRSGDPGRVLNAETLSTLMAHVSQIAAGIRIKEDQFHSTREQFLAAAADLKPDLQENRSLRISQIEGSCRTDQNNYDEQAQQLHRAIAAIEFGEKNGTRENAASLRETDAQLKAVLKMLQNRLEDRLDLHKAEIYQAIGGPEGMLRSFDTPIRGLDRSDKGFGKDNSLIRSVDLIPREAALNVNTAHDLVRNSALSFVWNTLFSFGLKVDYQRQKENYEQFMQQQSFSSSFGKGQATFGWTFAPLPGTRVLNSGDRTTYAVLEVPDDTSYLEVEGLGCAFRRTKFPLRDYPEDLDGRERADALTDYHCGDKLVTEIRVPDRTNSGGFWISGVDYQPVERGHKASVILRGGYFPPETTILVNGVRIPQVLGVGKPMLNMDAGPDDSAPDSSAIAGAFEYVNREQLTLNLNIPENYDGPRFPEITVVAPARAQIINSLRLSINKKSSRLEEEELIKSPLGLATVQYLRTEGKEFTAQLNGQGLTDLAEVRLNGKTCKEEILNDNAAQITCNRDTQSQWDFVGIGSNSDTKQRWVSSLPVPNPRLILLSESQVLDGTQYGDDLHPSLISMQLTGSGFTPLTVLAPIQADRQRFTLKYVNATTLLCVVQSPQPNETVIISDEDRDGTAAIIISRPPDKKKDDPPPKSTTTTTTTQTQKKVVEN